MLRPAPLSTQSWSALFPAALPAAAWPACHAPYCWMVPQLAVPPLAPDLAWSEKEAE